MNLKRTFMIVTVLMAVGLSNYSVKANVNEDVESTLPPIKKLSRGIVNVAIGVLEIPMSIIDTNNELGGFAAVVYGTLKGFCFFIAREVVGIIEITTFLIPLPGATDEPRDTGWGYGPIMHPEWVVDEEHDWYNFVHPDYPPE